MTDTTKKPPIHESASARMRNGIRIRYTTEDASLVVADEVAKEYEPRVAELESKLADLLKRLGEPGDGGKKGK